MPPVSFLECVQCGSQLAPEILCGVCPRDGGPLRVRYAPGEGSLSQRALRGDPSLVSTVQPGLWRYHSLLPSLEPPGLSAGWTPLIPSRQHPALLVKEEGANPSGSWEARGAALAVAAAHHFGVRHLASAASGNEASALAAFTAVEPGFEAHLFLARGLSRIDYLQAAACTADVQLLETRDACSRLLVEFMEKQHAPGQTREEQWFDFADFAPYTFEGAKTLGFEIVEQCGWQYPEAILLPGDESPILTTLTEAFTQLEERGWVHGARPRLIVAVRDGAATPHAHEGLSEAAQNRDCATLPIHPAVAADALRAWARREGWLLSDGLGLAAYRVLLDRGELQPAQRVILINPVASWKRADALFSALTLVDPRALPASLPVGGIITPI